MSRKIIVLFVLASALSLSITAEESEKLVNTATETEDISQKNEEKSPATKDDETSEKNAESPVTNTQTETQATQDASSQNEQKVATPQETEPVASQDAEKPAIDQKAPTEGESPSITIPKKPVFQENPILYTDPQAILIDEFGQLPPEVENPPTDRTPSENTGLVTGGSVQVPTTSENAPTVTEGAEQEPATEAKVTTSAEDTASSTDSATETGKTEVDTRHFERWRKAFAFGIDISGMGALTYFTISDVLKETLEINLNKLAQAIPRHGYSISAAARSKVYLDIYIKSKYEFGLFANVDAKMFTTLPKDLINFLAKGNKNTPVRSGDIIADSKAFADVGMFFGMRIGKFKFKVSSAYFVPLIWVNQQKLHYTFSNDPNTGKLSMELSGNFELYSPILPLLDKKNKSQRSGTFDIADTLKRGGLDVDFDGTYEFAPYAQLNFGVKHIPFVPSRMKDGLFVNTRATVETKGLLEYGLNYLKGTAGSFFVDGKTISTVQQQLKKVSPTYVGREAKIMRPLKMYISADIYPFKNQFLILTPRLGMNFFKPIYIDFGLKTESSIYGILGFIFDTGREDRVWKNKLGFYLDSRLFRLEVAASSTGGTFVDSFRGAGVQLDVGLVLLGF